MKALKLDFSIFSIILFISLAFPTVSASVKTPFPNLPVCFVENQGQTNDAAAYYIQGSDKTLYFTPYGITFDLRSLNDGIRHLNLYAIGSKQQTGEKLEGIQETYNHWTIRLEFVDSNPRVRLYANNKQNGIISYFKGKPEEWLTNIPTYEKLVYEDIWPGIDLVYSGTVNRLKYEFIVKPGADPSRIKLRYLGASMVSLTTKGELQVTTPVGCFVDDTPIAFQYSNGKREKVSMSYAVSKENMDGDFSYTFKLGAYDSNRTLILDPAILLFCGYIGGKGYEDKGDVDVDRYANVYVTGVTSSSELSFPVKVGPSLRYKGEGDVYIAKVNASGTGIDYCGYIGGRNREISSGIKVDDSGCAYIIGYTNSTELDGFPVCIGPDSTYNGGDNDGFIAKVNSTGSGLCFCGYIGGDKADCEGAGDIDIDREGNIYITGYTYSDEKSFRVIHGPDLTYNGTGDAFVAKFNAQATQCMYCGYIGGTSFDAGMSIRVDDLGNVYVGGHTESTESSFPVKVGPDLTFNGKLDGFVVKINATGDDIIFAGYLGGSKRDDCSAIAVDDLYNVYLTGQTNTTDGTFPCLKGPDLTFNGLYDAYVAKVKATGDQILYCGYIGGESSEYTLGIEVDKYMNAYIMGRTTSDEDSFPVLIGPDLTYNGGGDAFIAKINELAKVEFCGYVGGDCNEHMRGMSIDNLQNLYIFGSTLSTEATLPVQIGPDLTHNSVQLTYEDAFLAKILQKGLYADKYELSESGDVIHLSLEAGEENKGRKYLVLGALNSTNPGSALPGDKEYLPFVRDHLTYGMLLTINTNIFDNFFGSLDQNGHGEATLNIPSLPSGHVGDWIYLAFVLNKPFDFVSNPVPLRIVK